MTIRIRIQVDETEAGGPTEAMFAMERNYEYWFCTHINNVKDSANNDELQQIMVFRLEKGGFAVLNYGHENSGMNCSFRQLQDVLQLSEYLATIGLNEESFMRINKKSEKNGFSERLVFPSLIDEYYAGVTVQDARRRAAPPLKPN